jgi:zinc protease
MRFFIFALCIVLFPLSARADLLNIQPVTSPGGIQAWLVEDHSVPVIAMEFAFRGAGSANDPVAKQGLARLVSNTLDEGAGDLNAQAFQKELQDLVVTLRFEASRDHFSGSLKTLTKNKDRAFELAQMALLEPRFDNEAIERMRSANESRIRSSLSDPEWMAARLLNDKAYTGHAYALNSGGTLSSLKNISQKDLKTFHKNFIGKNNLVIAVSGDITAEELSKKLDETFGALPQVTPLTLENLNLQNAGKTFLYAQDIPQTVIQIIQPGIERKSPDYHAAQIMNFVLGSSGFGSRLTEEIREKRGLTYGIYTSLFNLDHVHGLTLGTSTRPENVVQMLGLIRGEYQRMTTSDITTKELLDAKSYLIGSVPLSLTSTDKIAQMLLSLQLENLPMNYLDIREKELQAATIQSIRAVAHKVLAPAQLTTILVGQPQADMSGIDLIEALPNVE